MQSPLHVHALCLLVVVALLSLGASNSRPPDAVISQGVEAEIVALRSELDQVRAALVGVEDKVQFITIETENIRGVTGPHMIVTGCNVHLRSGSEATDDGVVEQQDEALNVGKYKGLGNLIIGYSEGVGGLTDRQGSHNLVIGKDHKFPSVGGLVAGDGNTAAGRYASASGGYKNVANGNRGSVCGGFANYARGNIACVVGGYQNSASGSMSSVLGGEANNASGDQASVAGGQSNSAIGKSSSVPAGYFNKAHANYSSVTGGRDNAAEKQFATVSGGEKNAATGEASSISGGLNNKATGKRASISDGKDQTDGTDL